MVSATPLCDFVKGHGQVTWALMEKATQTRAPDWNPNKSVWWMSWHKEPTKRDELRAVALAACEINEVRERLPQKQVDMPAQFVKYYGPGDTKLGRGDENHRMVGLLADMAICLYSTAMPEDMALAKRIVTLCSKILVDYADDPNSYLSKGGVRDPATGKLKKYLGDTGRWRKFAMIARLLFDAYRIHELPGFGLTKAQSIILIFNTLYMHLKETMLDLNERDGMLQDVPKNDHLPYNEYVCPFQMWLAYAALERWRVDVPELTEGMAYEVGFIQSALRVWTLRGVRYLDGQIVGAYYDVPFPNFADVATVAGNVPFKNAQGVQEDAHDGNGVALHLAGLSPEFDAWLKASKASELAKDPAMAAKFNLE